MKWDEVVLVLKAEMKRTSDSYPLDVDSTLAASTTHGRVARLRSWLSASTSISLRPLVVSQLHPHTLHHHHPQSSHPPGCRASLRLALAMMSNQIREVWAENLDVEMAHIRDAVERYPYVAMVRPLAASPSSSCSPSSPHLLIPSSPSLSLLARQDTEFPGIVARPIGTFKGSSDYHYQTLRCNVDLLKLIQLGITLCDAEGNFPPDVCTWQ